MKYPGRSIKDGEQDKTIVRAIQTRLNELGCGPLDAKGDFGPKTKASVKLFQARNVDADGRPLKQDGQVGSLTWAALFGPDTVPVATQVASPLLAAVLSTAASQVGVLEQPKNSNSGPQVDAYLRRAGVPLNLPATQKPWCCAFVHWCFDEAARAQGRANVMVRTGGCLDHWNRAGAQGTPRIAASKAVNDPSLVQPGMIFIMDHGEGRGHTGLVEQVAGGMLHTIEGNTDASLTREGGGVYRLKRKIADINKGFIDYGSA
jgi:peptidoglycan hydrolase-like protein with peptidoglycan-binding domain